eukprot:symbB.v1.2.003390.t1/scaffold190.1/size276550/15
MYCLHFFLVFARPRIWTLAVKGNMEGFHLAGQGRLFDITQAEVHTPAASFDQLSLRISGTLQPQATKGRTIAPGTTPRDEGYFYQIKLQASSRVLRSNCFGPNSSHSSLRLEQVKELVTAVAMAAPTVISMVSTPPRATNQAARETVTLSSTSPGIGYHFGAIPTAVAVATGPVTMTTNTVMAPNTVTLAPKVVTVAPVAAPVTLAPNPVKAPNPVTAAPNSAMVAPNSVGVQPTSSQPVPRASAPPTSLHLDFTKMTREQLNLYDDIPAPNAELAEWAESMKLMSPMSGYEFQGFNMPGSGRLSVPDTSESNIATVTPNPGGVALRNVTVVPKSVPAAPNPVTLAPTHSVPVAANPATVATGPVAFAPHTVTVAPNSVTLAPTHSVPVAANPATIATGPVAFAPHTVTVAPNSVTLAPTPLTFAPHSVPVAPNPANLVMVAPNSAMVAPNFVGVQPTSSQPVPRASAPPTNLHLDDIPAPNAELAEWAESMKLMSPMSGYEFQGFNMPGSGRLSVPDTSESNNLFNLNSQKDDRPVQALHRASHVGPAQVAAFHSDDAFHAEEVQMLARRKAMAQAVGVRKSISQAVASATPERVMSAEEMEMLARREAMAQAVASATPERLMSTMSQFSEVMPGTPALSSNLMAAQAPCLQIPQVPCSKSNFLRTVPSSPSEPDPLMWSDGVKTLGCYMAAKAMGNLPSAYQSMPPPSTLLALPTTFFDVDVEKVGLGSPLPLPDADTDLSQEFNQPWKTNSN